MALWWLAIVVRRVCDIVLDICSYLFLFLQKRDECSEVPTARSTEIVSTRVSEERIISSGSQDELIETLWRDVCEHSDQWWDNRFSKRNPKAPDFKHKTTKKALWIDNWFTLD